MKGMIRCYIPPINIAQLHDEIFVPPDSVYKYSKNLYEQGREHKSIFPVEEVKAMQFLRWTVKVNNLNPISKWIINKLIN